MWELNRSSVEETKCWIFMYVFVEAKYSDEVKFTEWETLDWLSTASWYIDILCMLQCTKTLYMCCKSFTSFKFDCKVTASTLLAPWVIRKPWSLEQLVLLYTSRFSGSWV